jgi:4-amino-4-deoxy-L-arabinose transferase-like glycosyltransferase
MNDPSSLNPTEQGRNVFIVLVVGIAMLAAGWVGYVGSDDHSYARGALGWLNSFPYVGDDHWTLRHTVVLPVAASLAVFGFREISLGLPSALLFLVFLGINYFYLQQFFGGQFALLTSVIMATVPLFAVQATFPQTTIVETLFVCLSFWLFYSTCRRHEPRWILVAAGVAAAFGFLTRETTVGLPIFYAILFLMGFGVSRRYYWFMAAGFVLVVAIEIIYFSALAGDPWYRYRIDLFHDAVDRVGQVRSAVSSGATFNTEGNLSVSVVVDPIIALLFNQEFGLLFWVFPAAAIWVWRSNTIPAADRQLLRLLIGLAVVWMVFISANTAVLYVVPRYYAVSTWAAVIIVAYALHHLYQIWQPRVIMVVGTGLVLINLLCVYVENKNPLFAERGLVEYVRHNQGIVYTDPLTLARTKLLLEFDGIVDRVVAGPIPPNSLFYFNINNLTRCKRSGTCKWRVEDYFPRGEWQEIKRIEAKAKISGRVLTTLGLNKVLPKDVFERFNRQSEPAVLYLTRVSAKSFV